MLTISGESTIAANEGSQPIWTSVIFGPSLRFRGVRAIGDEWSLLATCPQSVRFGKIVTLERSQKQATFAANRHSVSSDKYSLVIPCITT